MTGAYVTTAQPPREGEREMEGGREGGDDELRTERERESVCFKSV